MRRAALSKSMRWSTYACKIEASGDERFRFVE